TTACHGDPGEVRWHGRKRRDEPRNGKQARGERRDRGGRLHVRKQRGRVGGGRRRFRGRGGARPPCDERGGAASDGVEQALGGVDVVDDAGAQARAEHGRDRELVAGIDRQLLPERRRAAERCRGGAQELVDGGELRA